MIVSESGYQLGEESPFYVTGGTLPSNASSYIVRGADRDLREGLIAGEFCYVLNTRQMGKSSLMVRTATRLREAGVAVAVLDLTAIGQNLTPDQWYEGLLASLSWQLNREDALDDFSGEQSGLGPMQRFFAAIGRVALPALGGRRLVVFVDEIDAVRSLPFSADEFFAGIRECYNRRQHEPIWNQLVFCLLGVATPADLITDTRVSPFNIGRRIAIGDFSTTEASPLAEGIGAHGDKLLARVLYWTSGHPYMTQRLCRAITESPTPITGLAEVDDLCKLLFLTRQARDTDDNLSFVRNRLLRGEADLASLLDLYGQVRSGRRVKDDDTNPLTGVLRLSGVTKADDAGYLRVRNRIYDRVFDKHWVVAHMPDAELKRQRAAERRGVLRAAGIFGSFALALALLASVALRYANQANAAAQRANLATIAAGRNLIKADTERNNAQRLAAKLQVSLGEANAQRLRADHAQKTAIAAANKATLAASLALKERNRESVAERAASASAVAERKAAILARDEETIAEKERGTAEAAKNRAVVAGRQANLTAHVADMDRAYRAIHDGNLVAGLAFMQAHNPHSGEAPAGAPDIRSIEWRYLWDQSLDRSEYTFPIPSNVWNIAISADGKTLATFSMDGSLDLWDVDSHDKIKEFPKFLPGSYNAFQNRLSLFTFINGSRDVAYLPKSGAAVEILDVATGSKRRFPAGQTFSDAYLTPNGRYIVALDGPVAGPALRTIDTRDGHTVAQTSPEIGIQGRCMLPDGSFLTTSATRTVQWDLLTGRILRSWSVPNTFFGNGHYAIALPPDPKSTGEPGGTSLIIHAEGDEHDVGRYMVGVDYRTGKVAFRFTGNQDHILGIAASAGGRRIVTVGTDSTARIWDRDSQREIAVLRGHTNLVYEAGITPDGSRVVTAGYDGGCKLWKIAEEATANVVQSCGDWGGIAFDADAATMALIHADGALEVRRKAGAPEFQRAVVKVKLDPNLPWCSPAFLPDGRTLLLPEMGGVIRRFDTVKMVDAPDGPLIGHNTTVTRIAVDPSGEFAATTDMSGRLLLWNLSTGHILHREFTVPGLVGVGPTLHPVAFSPDGSRLAYDTDGRRAVVRDVKTWEIKSWVDQRLNGQAQALTAIAFSPNGETLATANFNGQLNLYDAKSGIHRFEIRAHTGRIWSVAFSADSRVLLTSGADRALRFWNIATGKQLFAVADQGLSPVLALSRDNSQLYVLDGIATDFGFPNGILIRHYNFPALADIDRDADNQRARQAEAERRAVAQAAADAVKARLLLSDIRAKRVPGYPANAPLPNLLQGDLQRNPWYVYARTENGAAAVLQTASEDASPRSDTLLQVKIASLGIEDWNIQLQKNVGGLQPGRHYVLQFRARASQRRSRDVLNIQMNHPNYDGLGLFETVALGPDWRAFRYEFTLSDKTVTNQTALVLSLGYQTGTVSIADMVLVPTPDDKTAPSGKTAP